MKLKLGITTDKHVAVFVDVDWGGDVTDRKSNSGSWVISVMSVDYLSDADILFPFEHDRSHYCDRMCVD